MLDKVRNNIKSFGVLQAVIIVVVLAFIGTIFLVWGHGGKGDRQENLLAKVYDYDITYHEYRNEYLQLIKQYRQMYRNQWTEELIEKLNLRKQAFDNIVNQYILLHAAKEWDIRISEEEIMDHIRALPIFKIDGAFNEDLYLQRLGMANVTPLKFQGDIFRYLLFTKVQERIAGGFKISNTELWNNYVKENEKLKADYILVQVDRFIPEVQIVLDEIKGYYETNKEKYRYAERRSVEYLYFRPKDFEADANVTETEIKRYYNLHENSFVVPKQVKASHILLKLNEGASPEEEETIKKKIQELLEKIKAGEDFHALAKANSECPSSAKGGDLGYFVKGKMDPEFEKTAFALNIGEVSDVIKSSFGYHIIKVEDIKPEHVSSLDEVRDKIISTIKQDKGKELALLKAEDLLRQIYKGKFVRDFAFEPNTNYEEIGPFSMDEGIPGIGMNKEIMESIFSLEANKLSNIIETSKGYYIFRLLAVEPPRQQTFEEIETKVVQDAKKERAKEKAQEAAKSIREKLLNGMDMAEAAKEYNLTVAETGELKSGSYISGFGLLNNKDSRDLFFLKVDDISPVIQNERGFIILKIKEKVGINEEEYAKQKDELRDKLFKVRQQELFSAWIERIKKKANLEIYNEDIFS